MSCPSCCSASSTRPDTARAWASQKGAGHERSLTAGEAVPSGRVPVEKRAACRELSANGLDRAADPWRAERLDADQRQHQQRRVEVLRSVGPGISVAAFVEAVGHHIFSERVALRDPTAALPGRCAARLCDAQDAVESK